MCGAVRQTLRPAKGQPADAYTKRDKTVQFDGLWRKAKLTEADYSSAYQVAEKEYGRLLTLLIAQARQP